MSGSVPIGGYLPVSFIDWTGHVAPVLFLCGCNFRCPYCHNADLVAMTGGKLSPGFVLSDISTRAAFLDGVVVSGGEPTIHECLPEFLQSVRESTGLEIKLDTNGSRPGMLGTIIGGSLAGAVSMDVKAPWCDYPRMTGKDGSAVAESLEMLKRSGISFEIRTTFVPDLMSIEDLHEIQEQIGDVRWVIQCFRPGETLDPSLRNGTIPDIGELENNFPGTIVR